MTAKGPSWLKLDEDGKTWRKIPERVAIVKQIFQWAAQGLGAWQIVQRLNKQEVPPINPKGWGISSLLFLLRSRSVIGEFQPHKGYGSRKDRIPQGDPMPDYYPAVIDDKLFYKVQSGLNRRIRSHVGKPGANVPNLFTGLIHDARDGQLGLSVCPPDAETLWAGTRQARSARSSCLSQTTNEHASRHRLLRPVQNQFNVTAVATGIRRDRLPRTEYAK